MVGNLKCIDIGNNDSSIHIEHNIIYDGVVFEKFNNLGKYIKDFYSSDETVKSIAKEIKDNSSKKNDK